MSSNPDSHLFPFQLPLDAWTGGWTYQGIPRTITSMYTCFGRYTHHTCCLTPNTIWHIICYSCGWVCEVCLKSISLSFFSFFFQPSKQFRANGQNVSYVVSGQKLPNNKRKLCSTMGNYCTFQLPRRVKKVYLTAVNAAGKSNPTEVRVYLPKGKTDTLKPAWTGTESGSAMIQCNTFLS